MASQAASKPGKRCFVTIGATAAFDALIEAVLEPSVLSQLASAGYTQLLVQYGKDGRKLFENLTTGEEQKSFGIGFAGFDFDANGLSDYMAQARDSGGCVISHAGKKFKTFLYNCPNA